VVRACTISTGGTQHRLVAAATVVGEFEGAAPPISVGSTNLNGSWIHITRVHDNLLVVKIARDNLLGTANVHIFDLNISFSFSRASGDPHASGRCRNGISRLRKQNSVEKNAHPVVLKIQYPTERNRTVKSK